MYSEVNTSLAIGRKWNLLRRVALKARPDIPFIEHYLRLDMGGFSGYESYFCACSPISSRRRIAKAAAGRYKTFQTVPTVEF